MKYCLIGEKLSHSYSQLIHNYSGLDYTLKEIPNGKLNDFMAKCDYDGFNVTIPYKKQIIPLLDEVDGYAKSINAVNTVKRVNGKFYGFNTDVLGMKYMIDRQGLSLADKNVLILGSGATSNTARALCKIERAKSVNVVSRKGDINYENCYLLKGVEIIINTTPVGMYPNVENSPIDLTKFDNLKGVIDCVYNPMLTELLSVAKKLNLKYSDGLPMLVEQALLAQDIWNDKKHTQSDTQNVLAYLRKKTVNIVLCGMPSCGKSTIGKKLALSLNKEFFDSDLEIEKIYHQTPSYIITNLGEQYFRDIEEKVVKELAKKSGAVISLGGGAVLRESSVHALKRNGLIIYLERDINLLVDKDRPISKREGIQSLFEKRKSIYESCCDRLIKNDKDVESIIKEIMLYYESACN